MINTTPWMEALESQLDAIKLVDLFITQAPPEIRDLKSWNVDKRLLTRASAFAWSAETTNAVIEAGKSIPLDTPLNKWNLETETVWWHFAEPLKVQTVSDEKAGIRALCFGWIPTNDHSFGLPICCWIDDPRSMDRRHAFDKYPSRVTPSQTFEWERNITLGQMLENTRKYHRMRYGKGGIDQNAPQVSEDVFMAATEGCARFILAGLAWLGQKVLTAENGHVERHRRKEFTKRTKREALVRVVHLRRSEQKHSEGGAEVTAWTCRWVVGGHWRNQVCGPKNGDRKLTYILPYVKGPDDKPLRAAPIKVYEVSR